MEVYTYLRALVPAVQLQVSGRARDVADVRRRQIGRLCGYCPR